VRACGRTATAGGDLRAVEPGADQRKVAEAVFDAIGTLLPGVPAPLYARIDLVRDATGRPVLLELELTEPRLFLPQAPRAARTLVYAVEAELSR
jgi:hypothetical protein